MTLFPKDKEVTEMVMIAELRKKYLGAPEATDEDLEIVGAVREYVDGEIMPRRQDLAGLI